MYVIYYNYLLNSINIAKYLLKFDMISDTEQTNFTMMYFIFMYAYIFSSRESGDTLFRTKHIPCKLHLFHALKSN